MSIKATITENGNGLPSIGELCYDSATDTVYEVAAYADGGNISTNAPGCGNSMAVLLEEQGSASDTTDEEWDAISSSNYGVSIEEEEDVAA